MSEAKPNGVVLCPLMPSYLHELLVLLFRNHCMSAVELLRGFDVQLPTHDDVRVESSDLNDLRPAEYQADLVLFLLRGAEKVLGVIVEVQLRRDEDKPYTWPAYVANLRARHRCPVCLLVITVEEAVARWAGRPIDLGPGNRYTPWVIGPSNAPAITELQEAEENVELAVLSAIENGRSPDTARAARIASAAILASAGLDAERSRLYFDLILISLSETVRGKALQVMNSLGYEYMSDFARRYVAQGRAEGKAEGKVEGRAEGKAEGKVEGLLEGRMELLLRQLVLRFGPLPEVFLTRVRSASDAQLDVIAERVLTARTLDEALDVL